MNTRPYRVHVIVDPQFGNRLWEIPDGEPAWIADTEANRIAFNTVNERKPDNHLVGLTLFKVDRNASPEAWLISEIATIDLHHGEWSHDPPWSIINVIGVRWTKQIQEELAQYAFQEHEDTAEGFIAWIGQYAPD